MKKTILLISSLMSVTAFGAEMNCEIKTPCHSKFFSFKLSCFDAGFKIQSDAAEKLFTHADLNVKLGNGKREVMRIQNFTVSSEVDPSNIYNLDRIRATDGLQKIRLSFDKQDGYVSNFSGSMEGKLSDGTTYSSDLKCSLKNTKKELADNQIAKEVAGQPIVKPSTPVELKDLKYLEEYIEDFKKESPNNPYGRDYVDATSYKPWSTVENTVGSGCGGFNPPDDCTDVSDVKLLIKLEIPYTSQKTMLYILGKKIDLANLDLPEEKSPRYRGSDLTMMADLDSVKSRVLFYMPPTLNTKGIIYIETPAKIEGRVGITINDKIYKAILMVFSFTS
jgi:hypothetical protein